MFSSTRTAIQVAEEGNEEERLMNSLKNTIISEPLPSEITKAGELF